MTQAANILYKGHNFNILNFVDQKIRTKREPKFDHKVIRNDLKNIDQASANTVVKWFEQSGFVDVISLTVVPQGKLFYKERTILTFTLTEKYNTFFVLLRGLFGFKKPSGVTISSDRNDKSFAVEFQVSNKDEIIKYFETIFQWLSKEARFKEVLREVIRFEQKVNREQALLLSALQHSVW
jgi:hypothetical protein